MNIKAPGTIREIRLPYTDKSAIKKSGKVPLWVAVMAMDSESAINAAQKFSAVLPRSAGLRLRGALEKFFATKESEVSEQRSWNAGSGR